MYFFVQRHAVVYTCKKVQNINSSYCTHKIEMFRLMYSPEVLVCTTYQCVHLCIEIISYLPSSGIVTVTAVLNGPTPAVVAAAILTA